MGISPSKKVSQTLSNSPEFNPSCDSVFNDSLSNTQYAFSGIKPYQLLSATQTLHHLLFTSIPIISKWVPTPPDRAQVDRAYEIVIGLRRPGPVQEEGEGIGECLDKLDKWVPTPPDRAQLGLRRPGPVQEEGEGIGECLDKLDKWVPTSPDRAYKKVVGLPGPGPIKEEGECLDREEFRVFALEVFSNVVVLKVRSEVLKMVPIGVVGIGGVGVVAKANGAVLGAVIGSYVIGVATTVYLGLGV
ncbi:hypothetical protein LIER_23140 [Lithospermum erythrorhizon]|uniref:Uncharacterized protein n=1 Tax=Lithospermum erythrorhizon TaxID=34254 RepID=A0AAV3QWK4_LITER